MHDGPWNGGEGDGNLVGTGWYVWGNGMESVGLYFFVRSFFFLTGMLNTMGKGWVGEAVFFLFPLWFRFVTIMS